MTYPPLPTGRRIGFWVADDDVFSGDPIFGNAQGTVPTPQQFFDAYFGTSPYPATMVWTGGLQASTAKAVPPAQEAQWLNQLLTICDAYPDILIWAIFFVNLTGYSIIGSTSAPSSSTGLVSTGFSIKVSGDATKSNTFTITSAAGLAPGTAYELDLLDVNRNLIAPITAFTTDSTGAWTGNAAVPQTTDQQANQGGYVVVKGTHVGIFAGWVNDQTADFTSYVNAIKGHPSFIGALFEPEYFGNNATLRAKFKSIINGVGYYNLLGQNPNPANGDVVMQYSTYPYYTGVLNTGTAGAGVLGTHYGETGGPPLAQAPIWTQAVVQNIVTNSQVAAITIIISVDDHDNPAAVAPAYQNASGNDFYMYMSPILRGWIASDPTYSSFLQSGAGAGPTPTTLTLTAKAL